MKLDNLKADFAEFRADTILAIGFSRDKIIQKLEKKIAALEKTDKDLYVAKEAFQKLKNNLLSAKPYEKQEYQIAPEIKDAIDKLKAIETPSKAELNELAKLEYEVAKDKAIFERAETFKETSARARLATPEQISKIDEEIAKLDAKHDRIVGKLEKAQDTLSRFTDHPKTQDTQEKVQDTLDQEQESEMEMEME